MYLCYNYVKGEIFGFTPCIFSYISRVLQQIICLSFSSVVCS